MMLLSQGSTNANIEFLEYMSFDKQPTFIRTQYQQVKINET